MSNLEPIEEGDLDLKSKFIGGAEESKAEFRKDNPFPDAKVIENLEFPPEKNEKAQERSIEKEKTYSKILSKVKSTQAPVDDSLDVVADDAKKTFETATPEAKVDKLVKLAMTKGVVHAVKVAKHMDDNYVLDEFHDKLMAEEFHSALVDKGIIKEL
jgi:hypothetical protein